MAVISNNPTAVGTNAWTSNTNAYTSNDSYATCAPGKNLSVLGIWKTFGITDPGGTTVITKVEIGHEHKVSTTSSIATLGREISWNNGTNWSTQDVLSTALTEVLTDTINWLDVTSVTTWTWAALGDANLLVRIAGIQGNSSSSVTFSLDAIWVRVTYSVTTSTTLTKTSAMRWLKATTLTKTSIMRWRKAATISRTSIMRWKKPATVTKTSLVRWRLVTAVSKACSIRYRASSTLSKASGTRWLKPTTVAKACACTWSGGGVPSAMKQIPQRRRRSVVRHD
jgi:hypothetical protein